jgi:hypothetical protein
MEIVKHKLGQLGELCRVLACFILRDGSLCDAAQG